MFGKRARSIAVVILLAIAWVWTAALLAADAEPNHVQAVPQSAPDLVTLLLSGSGNAAMLAVMLWSKLTAQDKAIAEIKTTNEELKRLIASRPCIGDPETGECDVHGRQHRRRKGDA